MILVMSTKCTNETTKKVIESQHSPAISGELAPLFTQPKFVIRQEICCILEDANGWDIFNPLNVDSTFFMIDLGALFEWSQMYLVPHAKQIAYKTTLFVDDFPYNFFSNFFGSYNHPTPFASNQNFDTLHNYF